MKDTMMRHERIKKYQYTVGCGGSCNLTIWIMRQTRNCNLIRGTEVSIRWTVT